MICTSLATQTRARPQCITAFTLALAGCRCPARSLWPIQAARPPAETPLSSRGRASRALHLGGGPWRSLAEIVTTGILQLACRGCLIPTRSLELLWTEWWRVLTPTGCWTTVASAVAPAGYRPSTRHCFCQTGSCTGGWEAWQQEQPPILP